MASHGGRPTNKNAEKSTDRGTIIAQEAKWLEKAMETSQAEGKGYKHYRPLTQESFDRLRKNRDSLVEALWSDNDEAQVQNQWDQDKAAKPLDKANPKEQYLWKTCARFLGCLPTDLTGFKHQLEYDAREQPRQNWTQHFCSHLVTMIAHPMFENDPAKIALSIHMSVCAYQAREWKISRHSDLFLLKLKEVADHGENKTTGSQLIDAATKAWKADWPDSRGLPPWAQLLRAVVRQHVQTPHVDAEFPLRVKTEHLTAVIHSLEEIKHGKMVMFHGTKVFERALRDIRSTVDLPTDDKNPVKTLFDEGMLHNRRLEVLAARFPDDDDIARRVYRSLPRLASPPPQARVPPAQAPAGQGEASSQPDRAPKRGRGRPRKVREPDAGDAGSLAAPEDPAPKSKVGRPRKARAAESTKTPRASRSSRKGVRDFVRSDTESDAAPDSDPNDGDDLPQAPAIEKRIKRTSLGKHARFSPLHSTSEREEDQPLDVEETDTVREKRPGRTAAKRYRSSFFEAEEDPFEAEGVSPSKPADDADTRKNRPSVAFDMYKYSLNKSTVPHHSAGVTDDGGGIAWDDQAGDALSGFNDDVSDPLPAAASQLSIPPSENDVIDGIGNLPIDDGGYSKFAGDMTVDGAQDQLPRNASLTRPIFSGVPSDLGASRGVNSEAGSRPHTSHSNELGTEGVHNGPDANSAASSAASPQPPRAPETEMGVGPARGSLQAPPNELDKKQARGLSGAVSPAASLLPAQAPESDDDVRFTRGPMDNSDEEDDTPRVVVPATMDILSNVTPLERAMEDTGYVGFP